MDGSSDAVMDGYEATRRIRAMERQQTNTPSDAAMAALHTTKIIALTASASEDEHLSALTAGCNDFMPKPLQTDAILQKVSEHLSITYAYADTPTTLPPLVTLDSYKRRNVNLAAVLHADSLRTRPLDWLHQLYQATINLNAEHILELINAMPEEQALLAEALRVRVQEFDFEVILNLVQGAINASDLA
ncbi:MAG: hypothetical protein HC929_20720 [Leptolyngbyaceae cyanobacterium SM2_5_2]|nr:hypothetical protein [Leptolyngbyaceae cyanobacterium SM2_5_2]